MQRACARCLTTTMSHATAQLTAQAPEAARCAGRRIVAHHHVAIHTRSQPATWTPCCVGMRAARHSAASLPYTTDAAVLRGLSMARYALLLMHHDATASVSVPASGSISCEQFPASGSSARRPELKNFIVDVASSSALVSMVSRRHFTARALSKESEHFLSPEGKLNPRCTPQFIVILSFAPNSPAAHCPIATEAHCPWKDGHATPHLVLLRAVPVALTASWCLASP